MRQTVGLTPSSGNEPAPFSRRKLILFSTAALAFAPLAPAYGQVAPVPRPDQPQIAEDESAGLPAEAVAEPQAAEQGEITITGSRIASTFSTPTPVTSLSTDDLTRTGQPDIANVINELPQVRPSMTPASTGNLSSMAGSNFLDLRGIGYTRTLTLVDGRRYAPTTPTGGVSISSIPQALVRGVDIVTGGASAAYGSDAVAGVVNLRLNDRLEGVKGTLQGGITDHNDYRNFLASVAAGFAAADGRIRLVVAGEATQNSGIGFIGDRDWGARSPGIIANPYYTATNDEPRQLLTDYAYASNSSYGGVINSPGVLRGIQFAPDGSAVPFRYGDLVTTSSMRGGDGTRGSADGVGAVPVDRYSAFGRASADLSDSISVFAELGWSQVESNFQGLATNLQLTIRADNPFVPASVRSVMAARGIPSFVMGRSVLDHARVQVEANIKTIQTVAGVKGEVGSDWSWDAYYSYGRTNHLLTQNNNVITARFNQALDAVLDPTTGAIVCRSTLTDRTNGCVPINLIGEGRASQSAMDWTSTSGWRRNEIDQHVVAATLRGQPFSLWAGPVAVAAGAEYRKTRNVTTADPISQVQGYRGGGTIPYTGSVKVKEAFAEVLVPLASKQAWAKDLNINVAGRVTDYSTSGTVVTWKAGLNWTVNDTLRLRATRSRDIRAPSIEELFAAGSTSSLGIDDPVLGLSYNVTARNTGNPNLDPERADTFTAGVVFTPHALVPRLNFSIDYYNISIGNAIIAITPGSIVTQCYTTAPQLCSLIERASTGEISSVLNGPVNLQSVKLSGIDVEAAYSVPLGNARLQLRGLVNYIINAEINDGTTSMRLSGALQQPTIAAIGGSPHWRFNVGGTYDADSWRTTLAARYVGGGDINSAFTEKDLDVLTVNGRLYFDLSGEFDVVKTGSRTVSLFASIRNALDQDPPITGAGGYGTTRSLYDTIGRIYTAGARFEF